jgi:hypothetical protein
LTKKNRNNIFNAKGGLMRKKPFYKSKNMWVLCTLAVFLFFMLPAASLADTSRPNMQEEQDVGHLTGFIYESDGKTPLRNAQLILEEFVRGKKTGNVFKSNITDASGEYRLENIPEGHYMGKLMLNNKHYRIKRVDFFFDVIAGETNFVSFALKRRLK